MAYVELLLLGLAALLVLPCVIVFLECLAAVLPLRASGRGAIQPRPRLAVLVPACNEAEMIESTLATIRPQLENGDRLIVIADNCEDQTADLASRSGATVVVRNDPSNRGKGLALAFGLRHLADDPPEVVVFIDADCEVERGAIDALARQASESGLPAQAAYVLRTPQEIKHTQAVSLLAFEIKNHVRPLGLHRLRLPCLLAGTGMAFPWKVLSRVQVETPSIVEDLELSVRCALAGYPSHYCPSAGVTSRLVQSAPMARRQRRRWEHGHLRVILEQSPQLLLAAVRRRDWRLLALGMDLSVPPLSLLVLLGAALTAVGIFIALGSEEFRHLFVTGLGMCLLGAAVAASWGRFCRATIPLRTAFAIPFYALSKIPLYVGFLLRPCNTWDKTTNRLLA